MQLKSITSFFEREEFFLLIVLLSWRNAIPENIRVFHSVLVDNRLSTGENMKKRKWNLPFNRILCRENESVDCLFVRCDAYGSTFEGSSKLEDHPSFRFVGQLQIELGQELEKRVVNVGGNCSLANLVREA